MQLGPFIIEPDRIVCKTDYTIQDCEYVSIFDAHSQTFEDIRRLLDDIDINRLTPVEALLKLQEIKGKVK